ncbi:hypothetical protein CJO78_23100 (plasmid) [Ralstonia solanacearum]|nr:hypothetical protein LBM2029_22365 [Ralstonia solanacearum]AXV89147.1 hypothetical protein CJO78_23100 [Ralstonia solanacearum]
MLDESSPPNDVMQVNATVGETPQWFMRADASHDLTIWKMGHRWRGKTCSGWASRWTRAVLGASTRSIYRRGLLPASAILDTHLP